MTNMPRTDIDGLKCCHAIITPTCRLNRSIEGAIDEALRRIKDQYLATVYAPANARAKFHVVLTVDRWSEGCMSSNGTAPGHARG